MILSDDATRKLLEHQEAASRAIMRTLLLSLANEFREAADRLMPAGQPVAAGEPGNGNPSGKKRGRPPASKASAVESAMFHDLPVASVAINSNDDNSNNKMTASS
jgi:hypothetical protein